MKSTKEIEITSNNSQISLYNLLKNADLLNYYEQLRDILKLRNANDLSYCDEKDLTNVGMSRPEQKRLRNEYLKNFPSTASNISLKKLKLKVFGGKNESLNDVLSLEKLPTNCQQQQQQQHIILAEDISLCKELGKGEFGCVYQAAWHLHTGTIEEVVQVAVKRVLPEKLIANPTSFLQEAAIMTKMRHENVVSLYGVVLDTKAVMLVSELAPCGSLLECLQCPAWREPFPIDTLCDFALQIANGMQYLSSQRLIHRDLAARNVLVSAPNKVKISDFGLSRSLGVGEDYYRSEFNPTMKLPVAWCAPESINFLRFTTASDVWSYAVTLWEMFSYGKMPWYGFNGAQILIAIDKKLEMLEQPKACPTDFYKLMCECWAHEAEQRPTFNDICQRLPKLMPQLLITIIECQKNCSNEEYLQFDKGDLIILLNKFPPNCSADFWYGSLKKNGLKLGLFRPEETVAYLGAENPSTITFISNQNQNNIFDNKKTSINTTNNNKDKEKRKLLISQPQGDLRHTCHVGIDGKTFGLLNVDKNELTKSLPPMITTTTTTNGLQAIISSGNSFSFGGGKSGEDALSIVASHSNSSSTHSTLSPRNHNRTPNLLLAPHENVPPRPVKNLKFINGNCDYLNNDETMYPLNQRIGQYEGVPPPLIANNNNNNKNIILDIPPALPPKKSNNNNNNHNGTINPIVKTPTPTNNLSNGYVRKLPAENLIGSFPLEAPEIPTRRSPPKLLRPQSLCATSTFLTNNEMTTTTTDYTDDLIIQESTSDSISSTTSDSLFSTKTLDKVLNDLQKDITDFSLTSIEDFSDRRPLLDGDRKRLKELNNSKIPQSELLLLLQQQQQPIVRLMTPEEHEKWQQRVADEQKRAAKNLMREFKLDEKQQKRKSISNSIENDESESIINSTFNNISKSSTSLNSGLSKSCTTFTSQFQASTKAPLMDWSTEAQAAYKLLVQCGNFLKSTSHSTENLSNTSTKENFPTKTTQNTTPKNSTPKNFEKIENYLQTKKIEYINPTLVDYNVSGSPTKKLSLQEQIQFEKNEIIPGKLDNPIIAPKIPPKVPPKPKKRTIDCENHQ